MMKYRAYSQSNMKIYTYQILLTKMVMYRAITRAKGNVQIIPQQGEGLFAELCEEHVVAGRKYLQGSSKQNNQKFHIWMKSELFV